jgi:hypothetical protein
LFEGLEDCEARFFAPQAPHGHLLDRYQAKSANLSPRDAIDVFESFRRFDAAYPQVARVQTLVTPRLPPTLAFLARDPARVQAARPFYAPFAGIADASDRQLRNDIASRIGDGPLGAFVAESVEIAERVLPDRDSAMQAFGRALARAFPSLDLTVKQVGVAFDALSTLARNTIGQFLDRARLITTFGPAITTSGLAGRSFPLHIRSNRNAADETALEIDAGDFAGGGVPFPAPDAWADKLIGPLDRTAAWLRKNDISRIALSGSYRLSTAFALGWSLRSAIGFEIEIPTREGSWATDDRPGPSANYPAWMISDARSLDDDRLVVAVGVLRDPASDLLQSGVASASTIFAATMAVPITSGMAAQAAVGTLKRAVDATAARLRPKRIDLYLAGPAAFAVALGHRWNAMSPVQLFEFMASDRHYVPTARM